MKPSAKVTITPEMVERFAHYYGKHPSWGVLHVSFGDGNWDCACVLLLNAGSTSEDLAVAEIHDSLTESQRRRLRNKAEAMHRAWGHR